MFIDHSFEVVVRSTAVMLSPKARFNDADLGFRTDNIFCRLKNAVIKSRPSRFYSTLNGCLILFFSTYSNTMTWNLWINKPSCRIHFYNVRCKLLLLIVRQYFTIWPKNWLAWLIDGQSFYCIVNTTIKGIFWYWISCWSFSQRYFFSLTAVIANCMFFSFHEPRLVFCT